ncbi:MAG: hypothetical protein L0Z50_41720, partial [Verrucomicrobiales bacterium]|nr:hypothetical protein [Verrucomicrobiales bacterium]
MDELDYEQIVAVHHEHLYRFAFSLAGNPDDAAELTQETYGRLLTKGVQLRDRAKVKSWLFMNREEAKYLLRAYRVSGQDASDPQFREALEMLKIDPELARWFAQEQAVDRKLAEKIGSFPVPTDLK